MQQITPNVKLLNFGGKMNWEIIGSSTAIVAFIHTFLRNFKQDMLKRFEMIDKKFDKIDTRFEKIDIRFDKIDEKFQKIDERFEKNEHIIEEIKSDITEIKERISFLEATSIYSMPLEPVKPNARSAAAREMWARRRQKLDHKKQTN